MDSLPGAETVKDERAKNAVLGSLKLSTEGHHQEALRLMDDVITEAIREGEESWAFVFIRHAAILNASGQPDHSLLKRYYEWYLTHSPENPRALFGLADVTERDGQTYLAMQYFKRCLQALLLTQDEMANLVPWVMARAITPRPRT